MNYRILLPIALLLALPFPAAAEEKAAPLRISSFNLFHPPWRRQARLEAAGTTLERVRPDLVFLQETARGGVLAGDPVAILGDRLGLAHRRFFPIENLLFYRQGLALLSRFPIVDGDARLFAKNVWYETKGYLWAKVRTPRGDLHVINVHVINQSSGEAEPKASQFRELAALVRAKRAEAPVILGGDFNSELRDPGFAAFLRDLGARDLYADVPLGATKTTWNGKELLDYFFFVPKTGDEGAWKGVRFLSGGILVPTTDPMPSDHFPIEATLGR